MHTTMARANELLAGGSLGCQLAIPPFSVQTRPRQLGLKYGARSANIGIEAGRNCIALQHCFGSERCLATHVCGDLRTLVFAASSRSGHG